jgi:hypothetical protein
MIPSPAGPAASQSIGRRADRVDDASLWIRSIEPCNTVRSP